MTKETGEQEQIEQPKSPVSVFGYELIRDVLLVDILGNDAAEILYWGGKSLARRFPCANTEELAAFFAEAGWGQIELLKETKKEIIYRLSGGMAERRFNMQIDPSFTLESGFLAEQLAVRYSTPAEAICQIQKRSKQVEITVRWE